MKTVVCTLVSAASLALSLTAQAQNATYPTKPVRIVYPFAAGGGGEREIRLELEPVRGGGRHAHLRTQPDAVCVMPKRDV